MLDLTLDPVALTQALVDIESVSGGEGPLADEIERALRGCPGLEVERDGNVVLANTPNTADTANTANTANAPGPADRGRPVVCLAGHLDTVPIAGNLPARIDGDRMWGCGTSDMKSGLALALRVAHLVGTGALVPVYALRWVFYDCEEIEAVRNGLGRLARDRPDVLAADLAILLEPTNGLVEAGCQGTLRAVVTVTGKRAHSARPWRGLNAIHEAAGVLTLLDEHRHRKPVIDGLAYYESLNAVAISGGVAGNVIPDECQITVNFRFAPDRSIAEASDHLREYLADFEGSSELAIEIVDAAPAARPNLQHPLAQAFVAAVGAPPQPKLGWTDVARFAELGVAALNFGPGDPEVAHSRDEYVMIERIGAAETVLVDFLGGQR